MAQHRRAQMKRIVNGLAYDTDKSATIARSEYETEAGGEERMCYATLYRTSGGAFFEHQQISEGEDEDGQETFRHQFVPMSASAAQKWILEGDVELIDDSFVDIPEATSETAASATMYVRAPASLKRRVEEAAAADGMSLNAYVLRRLEQGLTEESGS
jgi:predicted HicB family RNase H-like nuclease